MDQRRWVQAGGISGILFVVFIALSVVFSGNSPDATVTTAKMVSYIQGNRDAVLASQAFDVAGSVIVIGFVGVLSYLFYNSDGRSPLGFVVLAAGAMTIAVATLGALPEAALALIANQPGGLDSSSATRALFEMTNILNPVGFCLAIFLAPVAFGLVRRSFAAPWMGWLSALVALVNLAAGALSFTSRSDIAMGLGIPALVGFGIVVLCLSVSMLRYGAAGMASQRQPALAV